MNPNDTKNTVTKKRYVVVAVTGLFAAIGAVLGVIAYYQQWLG